MNQNSLLLSNKEVRKDCNSKMVQNRVHVSEICPELEQIIVAWPELPVHIKAAVKLVVSKTDINKKGGSS